jgi:hypothetical protein
MIHQSNSTDIRSDTPGNDRALKTTTNTKATGNDEPKRQRQRFKQIKIPNYSIGNENFGDDIQVNDNNEVFYFHNINGIKSDENWAQILLTLQEHNVTCFGLAETNTLFARSSAKEHLTKL